VVNTEANITVFCTIM